jgi:DNA-binding NarL/FixJ family response regulator
VKKTVLVHGDQNLFCNLLGSFLAKNDYIVIKESTDIWETIEEIRRNPPSVILIDARRSKANGLEDAAIIKGEFPRQKVVILSASSDPEDVVLALDLGIEGYFLKSTVSQELLEDLDAVCKGELRVSHELVGTVVRNMRNRYRGKTDLEEPENFTKLTPRENEIMVLIAHGKTNKEIASLLLLSPNTVKNHVISILDKLNVHTRTGAVSKWKNMEDKAKK